MRNRSRPPKAVRAAKGGGKDRARSQPASQAEAPPGVRPPPAKPERSEQPPPPAAPADESSSSSRTASSDSDSDTGQGPTPPVVAPGPGDKSARLQLQKRKRSPQRAHRAPKERQRVRSPPLTKDQRRMRVATPLPGRQRRSLSLVPLLGP